jgi:curved DNA-binding protein CbpA
VAQHAELSGEKVEPKKSYYQVLGVRSDASKEDIERAYFELARKLHPDVAGGGHEAQTRFMLINEAYQTLISPKDRAEYDSSIGVEHSETGGGGDASSAPAATAAKPKAEPKAGMAQKMDTTLRRAIKTARRLCDKGDFWQATDILQKFLVNYPRQPVLRRALARAAAGKFRYHEAAEHLKIACEVEYFNSENHALLGEMYLRGKQYSRAKEAFMDALSWDEDNEEAREGLARVRRELGETGGFMLKLKRMLGLEKGGG